MPAPAIFICYRRGDSNSAARGIYDRLSAAFGASAVFLDHFDFKAGEHWREKTRPAIAASRAVIVVIHKDWLTIARKRFSDPDDPVRQELELAREGERLVIPVTVDDTRVPADADLEDFRSLGEPIADLLTWLFAKTALTVRFDRSFEADLQHLITVLDDHPGIDRAGTATSIDVGGLRVLRPWAMAAPRPPARQGDARASDLWILQAKYRAIPLIGRDADLASLRSWLDSERSIAVRLIAGRAGAGKTRLALEFLWEVFRDRGNRWDAAVVTGESIRQPRDWNDWTWRRSTLLVIDNAQALEESVAAMLSALCLKAGDSSLPVLRLLLLERDANATEGWFRRLIERESSVGGGAVRELFDPDEPMSLSAIDTLEQRHAILVHTLAAATEHDGRSMPAVPEPGSSAVVGILSGEQWREPLYLMMAALVARDRWLAAPADSHESSLVGLSLGRTDLALELARNERRRLDLFVPEPVEAARRLLRHLAACATFSAGFTAEEARIVAEEESEILGIIWPRGPGDLAMRLHDAFPGKDRGVAPVLPDIVGEAFVLATWPHDGLSRPQQRAVVSRLARRQPNAPAAMLFRTWQDFAADDERTGLLLEWIDALIELGLEGDVPTLLAIENALPHETTVLREPALRVTESLYALLGSRMTDGTTGVSPGQVAGVANHLAIRLGFVGRWKDSLAIARRATAAYRRLVEDDAEEFRPGLAMALGTLGNALSAVGSMAEAAAATEEAASLLRPLAARDPSTYQPDLALALSNLAAQLHHVGHPAKALDCAQEAAAVYRTLVTQSAVFRSDLARALNNLANRLGDAGRDTESLATAREMLTLFRALALENPDAFRPALATASINLASELSKGGRQEEARKALEEAVAIRRELALQNPGAFRPALAASLENLARLLHHVGWQAEALPLAKEAVTLYRALAAQSLDASVAASSLWTLGRIQESAAQDGDALASYHESVAALAPSFLAWPQKSEALMRSLLDDYLRVAGRLDREPEAASVAPLLDALARLESQS